MNAPRGPERRDLARRSSLERRYIERRDPLRATPGRRVLFPFGRRVSERRFAERRTDWPLPQAL